MPPWLSHHRALVGKLGAVARAVVPKTVDVSLDVGVYEGIVRVKTDGPTTTPEKTRLRTAIDCVGRYELPAARHWRCDIQSTPERSYVSHVVDWRTAALRRPRRLLHEEDVCVFPLTLVELEALASVREMLRKEAQKADVVATFALGGLPPLHWLTVPIPATVASVTAALQSAGKYHLLPGLNWSGTEHEKNAFRRWLTATVQCPGGRVLIFDTGTEGNGVRQALGLAEEALQAASPRTGAELTVLGVLDGRRRCGRRLSVRCANGVEVPVRLTYRFVPHLPTEDCELLAGYQVDRDDTVLHSIRGLVLLRVIRRPLVARALERLARRAGVHQHVQRHVARFDRYTIVSTTSGGTSLGDLLASSAKRRQLAEQVRADDREDREFVGAGIVLDYALDRELESVNNAIVWGLVPAASRPRIEQCIRGRFEQARNRLLQAEWNREQKAVVVL